MLTDKVIVKKIYLYSGVLHKVKRVNKTRKLVTLQDLQTNDLIGIPLGGAEILLSRVYSIGEVARIVERKTDTIRKYERGGLIPKPFCVGDDYPAFKGWRFYTTDDVYEMVEFFANRTPGRPTKPIPIVDVKINNLNEKIKFINRSFNVDART